MNKKVLVSLSFVACTSLYALREVVDTTIARVNGVNILKSDLELSRVDAQQYKLDELITRELYVQEAAKRKMMPSVIEVEKNVAAYKSSSKLTDLNDEQFEEHLKGMGFTFDRYKIELTRHLGVSTLLQSEVRSRVFVTEQEVDTYYNRNPKWKEEQYLIKTAIVPFDEKKSEAEMLKAKPEDDDWVSTDEWISKSDIADHMIFVISLKKGELSQPIKTAYGNQYVMVEDRKERRLEEREERYVEIKNKLQGDKMNSFEKEFQAELKSRAVIAYL